MASVVINADDFGISDGVCRAIIELLESGAVSNTTVMVTEPRVQERTRRWGISYLHGVAGLHLQLTGGKPISPASEIRSIADPISGNFLPREALSRVDPADVEREWLRQIDVVTELLGGLPTHLDSHRGVHRLPDCSDVYLSIASKLKIPVRGGGSCEFEEKMRSANVPGTTKLLRDWTGRFLDVFNLKEMLKTAASGIMDGDIIEVVTHPGYWDNYLESISSLSRARDEDRIALEILTEENWLTANGFTLVAYPRFCTPIGKGAIRKWHQSKP